MIITELGHILTVLSVFGGIAGTIVAFGWARAERIRAERTAGQPSVLPADNAVLSELKAMRQQMEQMQSTSHQFDISFDEALSRLEGRINRLETKSAVGTVIAAEETKTLRNGQSQ